MKNKCSAYNEVFNVLQLLKLMVNMKISSYICALIYYE